MAGGNRPLARGMFSIFCRVAHVLWVTKLSAWLTHQGRLADADCGGIVSSAIDHMRDTSIVVHCRGNGRIMRDTILR